MNAKSRSGLSIESSSISPYKRRNVEMREFLISNGLLGPYLEEGGCPIHGGMTNDLQLWGLLLW